MRKFILSLLALAGAQPLNAATFQPQGTNLVVASNTLQVRFTGADVSGIANLLTGETYVRNPSSLMQLNLTLAQPPSQGLAASGTWTVNSSGTSASLTFTDSNRTITVSVSVDPVTQEVVVDLDGKATQGGVEQLYWGVTGFDLEAGKLILPVCGGLSLVPASFAAASSYVFNMSDFGGYHLEAPLSLYQTSQGGVAIYSTDTNALFKDVTVSANQLETVNELFEVEAPGPWATATEAGPIEWRLAAYQGDWQAGARIYRNWHNTAEPPVALSAQQAWVNNIEVEVRFGAAPPYVPSSLDTLTGVVDPAKTLIYLVNWRTSPYDVNYPDYTPDPSVKPFVDYAHELGFHVLIHTDMVGVSPLNSDWATVQQFQAKDPLTLQPEGFNWSLPASTPLRYGFINPASSVYRQLFVNRVATAVQAVSPDVIHLDIATSPFNDGNGLIDGMNYNQGEAQLHRDLLAAFPGIHSRRGRQLRRDLSLRVVLAAGQLALSVERRHHTARADLVLCPRERPTLRGRREPRPGRLHGLLYTVRRAKCAAHVLVLPRFHRLYRFRMAALRKPHQRIPEFRFASGLGHPLERSRGQVCGDGRSLRYHHGHGHDRSVQAAANNGLHAHLPARASVQPGCRPALGAELAGIQQHHHAWPGSEPSVLGR